jgi:hypothetical protein
MVLNGKMPFITQSALFDLVSRNPQKNSSAKINSHFNGPEQKTFIRYRQKWDVNNTRLSSTSRYFGGHLAFN